MPPTRRINVDLPLRRHGARCSRCTAWRSCSPPGRPTSRTPATGAYKRAARSGSCVGIVGAFAVSRASVRLIEWMTVPAYALTHRAAASRCSSGSDRARARRRARRAGSPIAGHRLGQPAEFAKLTVVLMLAQRAARRIASRRSRCSSSGSRSLVAGVPWLLIMAQPDLGTAIVFVGIFFAMLFWAGVPWQLLLLLASPVISLILGVRHRHLGRVVPAAARARALVQAVPRRGRVRRRGERDDGHRRRRCSGST